MTCTLGRIFPFDGESGFKVALDAFSDCLDHGLDRSGTVVFLICLYTLYIFSVNDSEAG